MSFFLTTLNIIAVVCQDVASGKVAGLPGQSQQWQNLPTSSAGFPLTHSKTTAESASWDDLAAAVKGAGKLVWLIYRFALSCGINE